jgi:Major tropism determinant N-terminal domain
MTTRLQQRRDTAANWTSNNPTLAAGEFGYETDTKKWKVGDGSTVWSSLTYVGGGTVTSVAAGTGLTGGTITGTGTVALDTTSVYVVPSQSGNSGKYLTTNGTAASWGTLSVDLSSVETAIFMGAY